MSFGRSAPKVPISSSIWLKGSLSAKPEALELELGLVWSPWKWWSWIISWSFWFWYVPCSTMERFECARGTGWCNLRAADRKEGWEEDSPVWKKVMGVRSLMWIHRSRGKPLHLHSSSKTIFWYQGREPEFYLKFCGRDCDEFDW